MLRAGVGVFLTLQKHMYFSKCNYFKGTQLAFSGYLNIGMHGEGCPDLKQDNEIRALTKAVL